MYTLGLSRLLCRLTLVEGKKVEDPVFTGLDECTRATADTCIQK